MRLWIRPTGRPTNVRTDQRITLSVSFEALTHLYLSTFGSHTINVLGPPSNCRTKKNKFSIRFFPGEKKFQFTWRERRKKKRSFSSFKLLMREKLFPRKSSSSCLSFGSFTLSQKSLGKQKPAQPASVLSAVVVIVVVVGWPWPPPPNESAFATTTWDDDEDWLTFLLFSTERRLWKARLRRLREALEKP